MIDREVENIVNRPLEPRTVDRARGQVRIPS
jgi:hypothetical protein